MGVCKDYLLANPDQLEQAHYQLEQDRIEYELQLHRHDEERLAVIARRKAFKKANRSELNLKNLYKRFDYDPISGSITNAVEGWNTFLGADAGYITNYGTRQITFKGNVYLANRIIWMMMRGEYPKGKLSFKDGDSLNLAWDNIYRLETKADRDALKWGYD